MWIWFGLAVLALIGEAMSGTFYLLLVALGLAAAGLGALAGIDGHWQLMLAGVVAVTGLLILRLTGVLKKREVDASRNADVNLDIGQSVQVASWSAERTAKVWYRGAHWHADLVPDAQATPGTFTISAITGARLLLAPTRSSHE